MRTTLESADAGDILTLRCVDHEMSGRGIVREQETVPNDTESDFDETLSVYVGDTSSSRFEGWDITIPITDEDTGRASAVAYVWDDEEDGYVEQSVGVVAISINPAPEDEHTESDRSHATPDKRDNSTD